MSLPFSMPKSIPINDGYKKPPVVDRNLEYISMRREHAKEAMDDIKGDITGQGKPEFFK